jgi:hypothetical protein
VSVCVNKVYTTQSHGVKVSGVRNGSVNGNTVNDFTDYGVLLENITSVSCTGNSVNAKSGTAFPGIYVRKTAGGTSVTRNTVTGNTVGLQSGSSAAPAVQLTDDVTNTLVRTNVQQGFTGGIVLGAGAGNSTTADNIL